MRAPESTGIIGLDNVLKGGLRPASIVLIEGLPGTGKSILAAQFAVNSSATVPTLYLSFETDQILVADSFDQFGWMRSKNLHFADVTPLDFVGEGAERLQKMIRDSGVKRVVIDSLTPLNLYFASKPEGDYRTFLKELFRHLRMQNLVTVVVTESNPSRQLGETGAGPEHFLADTVITLRKEEQRRGLLRSLEIAKSRGQSVLLGRHSFRIEDNVGIRVFPRAFAKERIEKPLDVSRERVPLGVPGLEEMLGGGLYKGSSTLLVGISGTGKTVTGMQFINEGLKRGENCLIVSLDDTRSQMLRDSSNLGFNFEDALASGQLSIFHETPLEIELDAHFAEIEKLVLENKIERVVIDSVATYEMILPKEGREFFIALSAVLRAQGATVVFCYESPELLGVSQISERLKASGIADNIILYNYVEISTTLRRAITVPKTRGSKPDQQTREYVIKSGGIAILDETSVPQAEKVPQLPLSCYYGVLARSPTRHAPLIDESVAAGKPMPKSKIPKPVKKDVTVN